MFRILVVDDDKNTRMYFEAVLKRNGYTVSVAKDGREALDIMDKEHIDLVVLDVMMPEMDGYEFTKIVRESQNNLPILMVSAKQLPADKHKGFEAGTDDYITKPFSTTELIARVESLFRRVDFSKNLLNKTPKDSITLGDFELDLKKHKLFKRGEEIELTQIEYSILECFFTRPEESIERGAFVEAVWGEKYYGDDKVVDVNIRRLRLKIEDDPSNPEHLITVWGQGYRWLI